MTPAKQLIILEKLNKALQTLQRCEASPMDESNIMRAIKAGTEARTLMDELNSDIEYEALIERIKA